MIATKTSLATRSKPFLDYLESWVASRPEVSLREIVTDADGAEHVAVVVVDLINGFCYDGALASPRIAAIVPAARKVLVDAQRAGVQTIVFCQDAHPANAEEFNAYPPHCMAGTPEADTVEDLLEVVDLDSTQLVEKNSISSLLSPAFAAWEVEHPDVTTWIVIGDCTDLCIYQAAMQLKLRSMQGNLGHRVIVPVNAVETYDLPVDVAEELGAVPHDGDLLHHVFLQSMAQNGVEIVASLRP